MRFEGLLQEENPSPRARFRYLRATAPLSAESIMMSVADRLSVRGRLVTEADIERHLRLAREMMAAVFAEEEAEPLPRLIDGNDLMGEFGLGPGPLVGRLMAHVIEEQAMGNIASREEALGAAARFLEDERRKETGKSQ
jgi:poly(A) polymerase